LKLRFSLTMKTTCSIGVSGPIEAHAAGVGEALGAGSGADVPSAFVVGERGEEGRGDGSPSPMTEQDANATRPSATSVHPVRGRPPKVVAEPVGGGSRRDDGATCER
jgi:hypothetical protein